MLDCQGCNLDLIDVVPDMVDTRVIEHLGASTMVDDGDDGVDPFDMLSGMVNAEDIDDAQHADLATGQHDVESLVANAPVQEPTRTWEIDETQGCEIEEACESGDRLVFETPMFWDQCVPIPDALDPALIDSLTQELARLRLKGFVLPWKCILCRAVNAHCFGSCEICKSPNKQYLVAQHSTQMLSSAGDDHVLLTLAHEKGPAAVEACFALCQAMLSEPHNCNEGIYHYNRAFKLWPALDAELCMDTVPVSLRTEADAVLAAHVSGAAVASFAQQHLSGNADSGTSSMFFVLPRPETSDLEAFIGLKGTKPRLDFQQLFRRDRFPNVVVTMKGTVLVVWGERLVRARRSEDAGQTWGSTITIAAGIHSGGVTVDETTGSIFIFVEDGHPPSPLKTYESTDDGCSWREKTIAIAPDAEGRVPSMHMNEHGITLQQGSYKGRLLRASRWYSGGDNRSDCSQHFTNAIFSDDHGATWSSSGQFPAKGTGEAAITELSDGTIYYNSRRHWAPNGNRTTSRWSAHSSDGGATWRDLSLVDDLPDGPQCNDFGLFGGLVRLPVHGQDILVFSNCDSNVDRENGTFWLSFDAGKTWPTKRRFFADKFAYSALAVGRLGTESEGWIYCFFEGSALSGHIARFNLGWLLDHDSS